MQVSYQIEEFDDMNLQSYLEYSNHSSTRQKRDSFDFGLTDSQFLKLVKVDGSSIIGQIKDDDLFYKDGLLVEDPGHIWYCKEYIKKFVDYTTHVYIQPPELTDALYTYIVYRSAKQVDLTPGSLEASFYF